MPAVVSIHPYSVVSMARSVFNITGNGFVSSVEWYCRFKKQSLRAVWLSTNLISCSFVATLGIGYVQISGNDVDYTGALQIVGRTPCQLIDCFTQFSSIENTVTITGYGFSSAPTDGYIVMQSQTRKNLKRYVPYTVINDTTIHLDMPHWDEERDEIILSLLVTDCVIEIATNSSIGSIQK